MTTSERLVRELFDVATAVGAAMTPPGATDVFERIAEAATIGFGASAASIAMVGEGGDELEWLAAFGRGADAMRGVRLPVGRGIAGYVAATGQSLSVSDVRFDPRFEATVAEHTGFIPGSIECVPIESATGEVLGVLSILDADAAATDLALATALADVAATAVATIALTRGLGGVLMQAMLDAVRRDGALATSLRRLSNRRAGDDLLALAAALAEARALGPRTARTSLAVVEEIVHLARHGRRR